MINQVIICGRLAEDIKVEKDEKNIEIAKINIIVTRPFKNVDGIYESDVIPCVLWAGMISKAIEYCHKGDLLGIRGRLQIMDDKIQVIAEKITFLSSNKEKEEKDD